MPGACKIEHLGVQRADVQHQRKCFQLGTVNVPEGSDGMGEKHHLVKFVGLGEFLADFPCQCPGVNGNFAGKTALHLGFTRNQNAGVWKGGSHKCIG